MNGSLLDTGGMTGAHLAAAAFHGVPHVPHSQPHMQHLMLEHAPLGPDRQTPPHQSASGHSAQHTPPLPQLTTFMGQQPTASQPLLLQQQPLMIAQHTKQQENVVPPPAAASDIAKNQADWLHVPLLPGSHPTPTALAATSASIETSAIPAVDFSSVIPAMNFSTISAKRSSATLQQPTSAQAPQSPPQHACPAPGQVTCKPAFAARSKQSLAAETFEATRALMLRQQDTFTHQLFGLHCAVRRQTQQVATCRDQASYRHALQKVRCRRQL